MAATSKLWVISLPVRLNPAYCSELAWTVEAAKKTYDGYNVAALPVFKPCFFKDGMEELHTSKEQFLQNSRSRPL